MIGLLILNWILYRTNILSKALNKAYGCDPYNPATYENTDEQMENTSIINKEFNNIDGSTICTRL